MRCSTCGAEVPEGQTTCPSCGAAVQPADRDNPFGDLGAGSGGNGAPGDDTAGLPSWLQSFGEAAGATGGDEPPLPGWIETPAAAASSTPTPAPGPAAGGAGARGGSGSAGAPQSSEVFTPRQPAASRLDLSGGGGSFFSEDDLPEWLRALNADAGAGGGADDDEDRLAGGVSGGDSGGGGAATISVPPVTPVWGTHADAPRRSNSASLFAAVANAVEERPDVAGGEMEVATVGATAATTTRASTDTSVEPTAPVERKAWGRFRLYMLAAIVILLLLLLVMVYTRT